MERRFGSIGRIALFVGFLVASAALFSGAVKAADALKPPRAVATSTEVFGPKNPAFAGDTQISWYSADGTTAVVTTLNPAGQVLSVERDQYSIQGDEFTNLHTVLFPEQKAWATWHHSSYCSGCHDDNFIYPSPTLNARLLASHQLVLSGQTQTIDGQTATEVTSPSSGAVAWMSPTTDEVLTFQSGPSAPVQTFRWLPATRANLNKLKLNVPRGYKEATSSCAEGVNPLPPGTISGCRL
jgi:hypothetical protein